MIEKIINFSIKNKLIIILFTLTVAGFGVYAIMNIPIGAVPDITNNQVQVITTSGNLSTQEIEQFITAPVELEMANLPGVEEIRSVSKFGLSVVTIVFSDNMGTYLPRQLIAEKIKSATENIPEGFGVPTMGPITTGLGEIYQYILDVKPGYEDKYSPMELRTIQDWIVKRQLSGIPGVVEVNSWGGYLKEYEAAIDPSRLKSLNVTLLEVYDALQRNNSVSGGSYIEKTNQSYFIRGDGMVKSLKDIENIVVKNDGGTPILVKDVATVHYGYANRFGAITANGEGEKVMGQIMMLKDANSKQVINAVKERVAEVQKSLPEGVFINPILERSELIGKTSFTVTENLLLGFLIVVITVFLLLGNARSALVIASMIPLALLFTLSMMYIFGIDANLMSLGALDFGIIIDGAVIIVEFIVLKLALERKQVEGAGPEEKRHLMDKISFNGASQMMSSAVFGQIIILIVFIPILSLSGVEGKMFRPMALAFSFAIIGAMIFGFTWLPVAASLFLKPPKENKKSIADRIMHFAHITYDPVIKWSYDNKGKVLGAALISLLVTGIIFSKMGGEFVPTLDEGDFVIQPVLKTGTSLSKTIEMTTQMENILIDEFPDEVDQIVCRIGAAEVPTDPMSMEEIDMIIKLHPRKEWVKAHSKEELAEKFKDALSVMPGIEYEFTQPIEMRFNELITGVRADIAVKIFGEDLNYLNKKAAEIKKLIEDVPGAADVILEKTAGLPQMSVKYNREKIAYYGIDAAILNKYLAIAFGGEITGSVFEGEKRFSMVVRFDKNNRKDIDNIKNLLVPLPNGNQVPLKELADIEYTTGPAKISRENTHRRVVVSINVRNRDLQSVVEDIQKKIDANITLEPGYYVVYGGQFENLQNATKRLMFAVPLALLLIFIFLHFAFKSMKDAFMIFTAIPLSTVGGVFALWLRGMPFSVSAGIGFIALFGIAVLNGIVLIEHLKDLQKEGIKDMKELIFKGTRDRLRPVMLTAAAAAMGFLPMAISTGAGAEVQRPLATVVIGGLITSTMLTMIALPLFFSIFNNPKYMRNPFKKGPVKSIATILLLLVTSVTGFSQDKEISLNEAVNIAVENNKDLSAYRLMVEEQKALKPTAFSIEKTNLYYEYDENNIAENGHPLNVFGVSQNFSFPTVYSARNKINKQNITMAELMMEKQKQILTREVSMAYYQVQLLLNKKKIFSKIDSLYRNFVRSIEISYQEGEYSELDLMNARAKLQNIYLMLNGLNYDIEAAYKQLHKYMQYDSSFVIPASKPGLVEVKELDINSVPGVKIAQQQTEYQNLKLKLEKNKLAPDISLTYFIGSNNYDNAKNYNGFGFGLGIPLFFGEQKARIKANKIAIEVSRNLQDSYKIQLQSEYITLLSRLKKYKDAIDYYESMGNNLSVKIMQSAKKRYELGDIDFFNFAMSIENALDLTLSYYDNIEQYNKIALEINYLQLKK
ncbi:MAG: CusA/CzcA family heavy metal efflux RND transporter [Chlorobi bacterium]|nr:CusA/CzcA family heavy metal efflux RND transporter [Chlorobiota bacterium]